MSLKGKTAIVTGGSRGIGRAIAEKLAERGAFLVVNYTLSSAGASEVAQGITKAGGKAIAVQADVSKPADVKRLFAETEKSVWETGRRGSQRRGLRPEGDSRYY